jgi:hypothetical protein
MLVRPKVTDTSIVRYSVFNHCLNLSLNSLPIHTVASANLSLCRYLVQATPDWPTLVSLASQDYEIVTSSFDQSYFLIQFLTICSQLFCFTDTLTIDNIAVGDQCRLHRRGKY